MILKLGPCAEIRDVIENRVDLFHPLALLRDFLESHRQGQVRRIEPGIYKLHCARVRRVRSYRSGGEFH